jgi:hypothetical protein
MKKTKMAGIIGGLKKKNWVSWMEKDRSYAIHPVQLPREEVVADVETCIKSLPYVEENNVRSEV